MEKKRIILSGRGAGVERISGLAGVEPPFKLLFSVVYLEKD